MRARYVPSNSLEHGYGVDVAKTKRRRRGALTDTLAGMDTKGMTF